MSGRIAVELRRCAAGMAETQGWQLKLVELACTRIENAHKVRKKTSVFIYVAVICTTTGGDGDGTETCMCESWWSVRPETSPEGVH